MKKKKNEIVVLEFHGEDDFNNVCLTDEVVWIIVDDFDLHHEKFKGKLTITFEYEE